MLLLNFILHLFFRVSYQLRPPGSQVLARQSPISAMFVALKYRGYSAYRRHIGALCDI
jgi:hypothetical protein